MAATLEKRNTLTADVSHDEELKVQSLLHLQYYQSYLLYSHYFALSSSEYRFEIFTIISLKTTFSFQTQFSFASVVTA